MSAFVWDYFKTFSAILNEKHKTHAHTNWRIFLLPFFYQMRRGGTHTWYRYIANMYALCPFIQIDCMKFKKKTNDLFHTVRKRGTKCRMINVEICINCRWRIDLETAVYSCGLREATPNK